MSKINLLSNYHIVTIAVALLGGDSEHIDREDIAIKADEIAPGKFNWRKYPNRIDLDVVGVALRDAKKVKNGELIIGNNVRGWMLGPNGLGWISNLEKNEAINESQLEEKYSMIFASQEAERERLFRTTAYELYLEGKKTDIEERDFFQFARVNEYFKVKARERRFTIVENAVANCPDLSPLWDYLKGRFFKEDSKNV